MAAPTHNLPVGTAHKDGGSQSAKDTSASKPMERLPDSTFEAISRNLEAGLHNKAWSSRPRTWWILHNIGREDLMEEFILKGLNDTSIPYPSRKSLPERLTLSEFNKFMMLQENVRGNVLEVENGTHISIDDGDALFERRRAKLGIGSQGHTRVDKVTSKLTGKVYARKRIDKKKTFGHDEKALNTYENEIKTLRKTELENNEHLIKIKGTYTDKKYMAMLLSPVADGNLNEYMTGDLNQYNPLSSEAGRKRFRTYFGCLASTINFLHERAILHKDIKPQNVLLQDGRLILTDFGTAFDWSQTNQSMTWSNAGDSRTPRYQSPEVGNSGEFHRASDIWSLGVLFVEMFTSLRGQLLPDIDEHMLGHGNRKRYAYENLEGMMMWLDLHKVQHGSPQDNEILTWIRQMLDCQWERRPSAEELYEKIISFSDAEYCGKCCLDDDTDSDDSNIYTETSTVVSSNIPVGNTPHPHRYESPYLQNPSLALGAFDNPPHIPTGSTHPFHRYASPYLQNPPPASGTFETSSHIPTGNTPYFQRYASPYLQNPSLALGAFEISSHIPTGNTPHFHRHESPHLENATSALEAFKQSSLPLSARIDASPSMTSPLLQNGIPPHSSVPDSMLECQRLHHINNDVSKRMPGDFEQYKALDNNWNTSTCSESSSPYTTDTYGTSVTHSENQKLHRVNEDVPKFMVNEFDRSETSSPQQSSDIYYDAPAYLEDPSLHVEDIHEPTITHLESPLLDPGSLQNRKTSIVSKAKSFLEKEAIVQWLSMTSKKFKFPVLSRPRRPSKTRKYQVEAQRIGHFLSTLPEELGGYEEFYQSVSENTTPHQTSIQIENPTGLHEHFLKRSYSHETLEIASQHNEIEDDADAPTNPPRLIHYASDTDLQLIPRVQDKSREQTLESLRKFAMLAPKNMERAVVDPQINDLMSIESRRTSSTCQNIGVRTPVLSQAEEADSPTSQKLSQDSGPTKAEGPVIHDFDELGGPGVDHLRRREDKMSTKTEKPPKRLGDWINSRGLRTLPKGFESATVIMEQIMKTKTAEAPTTIMSAKTKAKFSRGRSITQYNDEFYGYLPYYVAEGKVGVVRGLLDAGCNPGTRKKPRPALMFKAVRMTSDRHIKCLLALLEYGADVNCKATKSGRRPIHYAIEQAIWSGYSTAIFLLLIGGANANVKDKKGDLPLLMLLEGSGPLPQQQRDVLRLLLAPDFTTNLDIVVPSTMDNPIHLTVRRKDAYAVEAVLDKMQRDGGRAQELLHTRNRTGLTPLLLAFSIYSFGEDVSEELRIIELLLKHHADLDDRDPPTGDTCLHRIVQTIKNTAALDLLCRHKADPFAANTAGETPHGIVDRLLKETPSDLWLSYARHRMLGDLPEQE